jgi:hypothetical protein
MVYYNDKNIVKFYKKTKDDNKKNVTFGFYNQ